MGKSITSSISRGKSRGSSSKKNEAAERPVIRLDALWDATPGADSSKLQSFAVVALGVTDAVAGGALSPDESISVFFNFENCHFVQKNVRNKVANEIMGQGLQLGDILSILPAPENQKAFRRAVEDIRTRCLFLIEQRQPASPT
jgi:hypothetical protein